MSLSSEPTSAKDVSGRSTFAWMLVLAPAIIFYGLLVRFGTAAPIIDDFWQIIGYALTWKQTATATGKWALLLHTQIGAYKPIFEEAVVGLQISLTGKLHVPAMVLVSNLTILGVFWFLWKNMPPASTTGTRVLRLLPVSLLLFSLNYAENLDWAGCALAQLTVLLFVVGALHFLLQQTSGWGSFLTACGCGLLASLCFSNGLVLWPVGLLYLCLRFRTPSWSLAKVLVWLAACAGSTFIFLDGNQGTGISAHVALWKQAVFLLSYVGGGLENMHHKPVPYLSVLLGVAMVAVVGHAVWSRFDKRNPFYFFLMIWVLLTGCGVANSRVPLGLQMALSSRYKIYCDLLLIICYVYGLDRLSLPSWRGSVTEPAVILRYVRLCSAVAFLFWVGADISGSAFLRTRQARANAAMRAYLADPAHASPMFLVEGVLSPPEAALEDRARQQTNAARAAGMYAPPPADHLGLF